MSGFDNEVLYADNVDFSGGAQVTGQVTADGQLLIGASSAPFIRVATLSSPGGTVQISNGPGTIELDIISTGSLNITTDSGVSSPIAGGVNLFGGTGIDTSGAGNTVTVTFDVTEVTTIPTSVSTDSGSATPAANVLTLAGGVGIDTSGAGSTATITFDVTEVTTIPTSIGTDSGTATPAANAISIVGGEGIDVSAAGSTVTVAGEDASAVNKGIATFDSGDFTVVAGNVTLNATGAGQTITGDAGGALAPAAGNWNIVGGTNGIDTSGAGSTLTINFDVSEIATIPTSIGTDSGTATPALNTFNIIGGEGIDTSGAGTNVTIAGENASDTNKGIASFDSGDFTVTNGNVVLNGSGAGQTITGDSGGALSPTAGNWNIIGAGSITTAGAGSTLTAQLTGLTNHAVLVGAGTTTITKVGPSATAGQILQSAGAAADPAFSTATYPSTSGTSGTILQSNGSNWVNSTPTYPATAGTSGNVMTSDGTNWLSSAPANSIVTLTGVLTSPQIKNLRATPIVAIPAPGSGKFILIGSSALKLNYAGTNAFSAAVAQSIHLVYTSLSNDIRPVMTYTEINGTVDGLSGTATIAEPQGLFSTFNNVAVSFTVDGAAEIGGNAANDNTITWLINYQIVTL